jgi:pilus assembly protein CpaB
MKAGQAFTPACFPKPGSGVEVAGLLAPGKRAVSVSLTDYSGIEALLYPGCSVDVLASFTLSPNSKIGKAVSTTLLEKVQVLAVEHITVTSEGSEEKEVTGTASSRRAGSKLLVTLMVDGKQAEALQLASEHGDISLALRNPTDNVNVEEDPTLLNEGQIAQLAEVMEAMVKEQEKAEKAEAAKEPEVASPPPEPEPKRVAATTKRQVTIQVIRGSKSETLSLPIKSN